MNGRSPQSVIRKGPIPLEGGDEGDAVEVVSSPIVLKKIKNRHLKVAAVTSWGNVIAGNDPGKVTSWCGRGCCLRRFVVPPLTA